MRAVELTLRNYRVFEELDLELPSRVIGIFGVNGAGKSSLVESILFALYGRARTKKDEIRTHGLQTECLVHLVFEHGGGQYEVRRTIRGRNHQTDAQLFAGDLQLAAGVTDVDQEIRRLLRMDQQVFRASVFAEQKQLDAFSDVTAGKRKEMVLRLLGIKPVDEARAVARRESRASRDAADQLLGVVADLAELEAALKEAKDVAAEAKARAKVAAAGSKDEEKRSRAAVKAFDVADRERQRVEKLTIEIRTRAEQRVGLVEDRDARATLLRQLVSELEEMPEAQRELTSLEGSEELLRAAERLEQEQAKLARAQVSLEKLRAADLEEALAALGAATADERATADVSARAASEHERATELLAAADDRLARAGEADPSEPCPTCGRELGSGFASYVKHCKEETAAAKRTLAAAAKASREAAAAAGKAGARLGRAAAAAEIARRSSEDRDRVRSAVSELRAGVDLLKAPFGGVEPDIEGLRKDVRRTKELEKRVAALEAGRSQLERAETDLAQLEGRIADIDAKLASLTEEAEALSFDPKEHARLLAERDAADVTAAAARDAEREALAAQRAADLAAERLTGEVGRAKETQARVDERRAEARLLDRVATLLDGFRDHLASRVGPELSHEAEALFRDLTNREYDDLRIDPDELRIEIADGDTYFPVERFSGSEADLANLALRVAISAHLSRVSGADVGMLVLDEVLGSLDAERKDLMVQTLGRLAGRFHQLFVITHAERVKDQFPASIEVRKTGRRRSIAVLD